MAEKTITIIKELPKIKQHELKLAIKQWDVEHIDIDELVGEIMEHWFKKTDDEMIKHITDYISVIDNTLPMNGCVDIATTLCSIWLPILRMVTQPPETIKVTKTVFIDEYSTAVAFKLFFTE